MNRAMVILGLIASLSLAGNMFVAGVWVAGGLGASRGENAKPGGDRRAPDQAEFTLRGLASGLPEAARINLRKGLEERRQSVRPAFFEMRLVRRDIRELMLAQEIDEAELRQAFARLRTLQADLQAPIHDTIVDAAKTLTMDERRRLVQRMETQRNRQRPLRQRLRRPTQEDRLPGERP